MTFNLTQDIGSYTIEQYKNFKKYLHILYFVGKGIMWIIEGFYYIEVPSEGLYMPVLPVCLIHLLLGF